MNDPQSAAILGYVLLALASLAGLGLALKQLLRPTGGSSGNGTHDVTRREFEEVKAQQKQAIHDLSTLLQKQEIELAILQREHQERKAKQA